MSALDPVLLREQLCADPGNQDLRRQYLACRTPELLARDRMRALLGVVLIVALLGAMWCALLGLLLGVLGSGTTVVSVGSVHIKSDSRKMEVRSHGIAAVSQGGDAAAAVLAGLSLMPAGALLGALAGLVVGACAAPVLAENGPRSWWGYCWRLRVKKEPLIGAFGSQTVPIEEVFLVHPESEVFLRGDPVSLPDRTPWYRWIQELALAGVMLVILQISQREEPPIPQRFLEAPWHPAPVPTLIVMMGIVLFLVGRALVAFEKWWRGRHLETMGLILYGRITDCTATCRTAHDPEAGVSTSFWQVQMHYEFTSPSLTIADQIEFQRGDLPDDAMPAPGTPVAIMYAGDHLYQIL